MREIIKFRGKTEDGKWIYGFYWFIEEHINDALSGKHYIKSCKNGIDYEVIPETVGQYIGTDDKKGKEIYKGDILKSTFEMEHPYIAIIKYGTYAYTVQSCDCDVEPDNGFGLYADFKYKGHDFMCCPVGEFFVDYEIIGNIYDNPELLEAKE